MSYYNLDQTLTILKENLPKTLLPFDLPQLADLCRCREVTPIFAYAKYAIEVIEDEHTGKHPEWRTTHFYDGYLIHERLLSLLDESEDKLELSNAITYTKDGNGYEVALVANALNVRKYRSDEDYSIYSDNDLFPVTRENLLFPSEQVQNYIASKQTTEQNIPEQQYITKLAQAHADNDLLRQELDDNKKLDKANAAIDEGQGDTLLILGAVMQCIRSVAKNNYTQQSLINAIIKEYPNTKSISESTLSKKFSKAKTHLNQNVTP